MFKGTFWGNVDFLGAGYPHPQDIFPIRYSLPPPPCRAFDVAQYVLCATKLRINKPINK